MRKYLPAACLGLALVGLAGDALLAQPVGPPNAVGCGQVSNASGGPSTLPLVVGVAGKIVNMCGFVASATAASTLFLISGSGATCATNAVTVTATHNIPAGTNMVVLTDTAKFSSATGSGICGTVGGTGPVQITIFYSQF